ncbi:cell division protein ZipA C-terminal FtsZ-binding domain-containing protein [Ramlibacter sp.]|uniref:cell division protein ZipA C-terminal FtsZ-binding domain-containing protein n=1 Tax=Ramlibacter sp. TaxID=1917967 RepID=UPI003D0F172E
MSEFTAGLAVLGGLILAGLVGYNAWTTRRNAPRQPVMAAPGTGPAGEGERSEPLFEPDLTAPPAVEKRPGLDALLDALAPLNVEASVAGELAVAALPTTRRAGSKPFAIEGFNEATQHWETPRAGQRYSRFQAGVQLANRNGALNEIEYSEFVMKAQGFADAVNASPEFPEMLDAVAHARELDQFASAHDAQLSITLRARGAAWSPGFVHQAAQRLGFVAGAIPGRMVLPAQAQGGPPVLGLAFSSQAALSDDPAQSAIREVTLSLDVPQVPRTEQPFVRMRDAAIALAASMDGLITDDNQQVIRAESLDAIGADLEQLYDALEARDIAAGSPQARRLFS